MKLQKQEPNKPNTDKEAIDLFTSIFNSFSTPVVPGAYITRAEQGENEGEIILKSEESPNLSGDRSNLPHGYYPSANASLSNLADAADLCADTSVDEDVSRTVTVSPGANASTGIASIPIGNLTWPSWSTSASTPRSTSRPASTFYELDVEHRTLRKIQEIYDSWYPEDPCFFDEIAMKELPKRILEDFCKSLVNDIQAKNLTSAKQVINYLGKKGLVK